MHYDCCCTCQPHKYRTPRTSLCTPPPRPDICFLVLLQYSLREMSHNTGSLRIKLINRSVSNTSLRVAKRLPTVWMLSYKCVVLQSAVSLPVFERQETKGDSNSVEGWLFADCRPSESARCLPCTCILCRACERGSKEFEPVLFKLRFLHIFSAFAVAELRAGLCVCRTEKYN